MKLDVSSPCTNCGRVLDAASLVSADTIAPAPGDITVCTYCQHLMAYASDMTLRDLTDAEIVELAGNEDMLEVQAFCTLFNEYRAKREAST
jgi:hypothetical protein